MKLKVNEIFETIQGEGASIGRSVTFLRLSVCNLHCLWCDTYYTWNFGKGDGVEKRWGMPTVKMEKEIKEMEVEEVAKKLRALKPRRVVISGGEPMLQQKALAELIFSLRNLDKTVGIQEKWEFEIETNGTVPFEINAFRGWSLGKMIDQINCSPKLESSGNAKEIRRRPDVLAQYNHTGKAYFKFVVCHEKDLEEIQDLITVARIDKNRVYLMPQGKTKAEQEAFQLQVQEYAQQNGYNFSPRLHVLLWGSKRGV